MVQEYEKSLKNKPGSKGSDGGVKDLSKLMEQTENDLVNKQLTAETLRRQEEIMTRLLEAEKAEREREKEETRQSKEAKDQQEGNPEEYFEYKKRKKKETELLRTVPPNLTPFYRSKVNQYFRSPLE
jgi:septal ring factor EnvC (AmiA/AmiB activator)